MNKHEDLSDCSSQSVLCAMDKFIKSVNKMNETVMVPCRLLDMELSGAKSVPKLLTGSEEPYTFYTLLNNVKNDLRWGPSSSDKEDIFEEKKPATRNPNSEQWSTTNSQASSDHVKGHLRRQSTVSMISVNSTNSDGDSEACSEAGDSGLDAEESIDSSVDAAQSTLSELKSHLIGLHSCLSSLTETADFITLKYQEDVNK